MSVAAGCTTYFLPSYSTTIMPRGTCPWYTTVTRDDTPDRQSRTLRLLNPGSPTDRRRQPTCTYVTATATAGKLTDVTFNHLPSP